MRNRRFHLFLPPIGSPPATVYQHQFLGATLDVDLLREVLVERYQIAPERIVFVYVD